MSEVVTVTGPVDPGDVGVALVHEHLFTDLTCWLQEPSTSREKEAAASPVALELLGVLHRSPMVSRDNVRLDNEEEAEREIREYKNAGGRTLVDVTPDGIGRDPAALRRISETTGVHVVCAAGYYVAASHPGWIAEASIDDITSRMVDDIRNGIGSTGVRAGIIGEIGLSVDVHPDEEKVLRAAARAGSETGAAVTIHPPWPSGEKHRILDILEGEGLDLTRVVMGHAEYEWDLNLHMSIAERGAFLAYDCFGQEYYHQAFDIRDPSDHDRIRMVTEMVEGGYLKQVLMSHDVSMKTDRRTYGGCGYSHILENVVPMMTSVGMQSYEINAILVDNPTRMLAFSDGSG